MNILVIWEQFEWGGVESQLAYILNEWPDQNDSFTVLSNPENIGANRLQKSLIRNPAVNFLQLKSVFSPYFRHGFLAKIEKVIRHVLMPILFGFSLMKYRRVICGHNPDIVLCENGGYPGAIGVLASALAAALAKVPVRCLVVHHQAIKPPLLHGWFFLIIERALARTLSSMIAVSHATRETLVQRTSISDSQHCPVTVIQNGVGATNLQSKVPEKRKELNLGIIGRVEPYKGHAQVLEAMSLLPKETLQNVRLKVIGTCSDEQSQSLLGLAEGLGINKCLEFCGFVDRPIVEIIAELDALVMATQTFEGFALTAVEALMVDVPVIATRVGIINEIFDISDPMIAMPGDVDDLASSINYFIQNRSSYEIPQCIKMKVRNYEANRIALRYRQHFLSRFYATK